MLQILQSLLPGLVQILLPACESAIGAAAPVPAKKQWIHNVVKDILDDAVFSNIPAASWVAQFRKPVEDIVLAEIDKLLAGPAPAAQVVAPNAPAQGAS